VAHPKTHKGNELAVRLAKYAGRILVVASEIPDTKEGRHVRDQLTRSGTAPGAHYAEARSAQSSADFIHKMSLAAKEQRESVHWLRTCVYADYLEQDVKYLVREGEELSAILATSLRTAQKNRDKASSK
jgi:four helix bundle protein